MSNRMRTKRDECRVLGHSRRQLGAQLSAKRALLEQPLIEMGFRVLPGQGAYFLIADARQVCFNHLVMGVWYVGVWVWVWV
jgi:hypothetical protein